MDKLIIRGPIVGSFIPLDFTFFLPSHSSTLEKDMRIKYRIKAKDFMAWTRRFLPKVGSEGRRITGPFVMVMWRYDPP
ncbi:hypothetical protein E2C01_073657 [Portunus trituberculatus]|uniref:Uncharacterized protein n=1 Tax=Portunus trituberculatus TaxID=210409 RepID=A0A5B7IEH9_PORTR|nr:hypothetical protein [Portunus trituberculatus]